MALNEHELRATIARLKAGYHEAVEKELPRKVIEEQHGRIKTLSNELNALLADGVKPCPKCKDIPMVMLRREAYTVKLPGGGSKVMPPLYEAGCCRQAVLESTAKATVAKWNQQYGV